MRQFEAEITSNEAISPTWMAAGFAWPADLGEPLPGQFLTFRPSLLWPGDAGLLRRPLAFAGFGGGRAYVVYQVRGPGTKALAAQPSGSKVDLLGPLGKAFSLPEPGESAVLVGGGVGIGPMLFLHRRLARLLPSKDLLFVLGFRTASQIPAMTEPLMGVSLSAALLATDDGSAGFKGRAAEAVAAHLKASEGRERRFYACGPAPMLAAIAALASAEGSSCQVSVEQWMACGVGACHGCVLPASSGGYLRACADGPVFEASALDWEAIR